MLIKNSEVLAVNPYGNVKETVANQREIKFGRSEPFKKPAADSAPASSKWCRAAKGAGLLAGGLGLGATGWALYEYNEAVKGFLMSVPEKSMDFFNYIGNGCEAFKNAADNYFSSLPSVNEFFASEVNIAVVATVGAAVLAAIAFAIYKGCKGRSYKTVNEFIGSDASADNSIDKSAKKLSGHLSFLNTPDSRETQIA